jgi:phage terminase small subunit
MYQNNKKSPNTPRHLDAIVDPLWKPVLKLLATNDPTSNLRLELWL